MCQSPHKVPRPNAPATEFIEVQCGRCWACIKNKQNDLVGRALCELPYAQSAWFLTLTYDDRKATPQQTRHIQKADLQNFFKRLRKGGHNLRYIAAGENGSKGTRRTHFHVIALWQGLPPRIFKYWNGKDALEDWPFGHVDIEQTVNRSNMSYVAKYATKKIRDQNRAVKGQKVYNIDGWLTYSKKPLLGAQFVTALAENQAKERLMPRNLRYSPPGGDYKAQYSLFGAAEELYLDVFLGNWPEAHDLPKTQWLYNSIVRWKKIKAARAFKLLTPKQAAEAVSNSLSPRGLSEIPLTRSELMRQAWQAYDRRIEGKTWLAEIQAGRKEEVAALSRELLHRFGFSAPVHPDPLIARNQLRALLSPLTISPDPPDVPF